MPCSSTMKSTPDSPNPRTRSSRYCCERPMRRSRVTTTSSPRRSLASIWSSFGREASLPETLSHPGAPQRVELVLGVLLAGGHPRTQTAP